ncbi:MAG: metal-dependent transcriptional regulator [Chloroflexota bacterium]
MAISLSRPSDRAEEALEKIYEEGVEGGYRTLALADPALSTVRDGIDELFQAEWARLRAGTVELTPRGHELARQTIRRHRLAERLLADVLEVRSEQLEEAACGMEHSLRAGVDEAVCGLLGHPRLCPHGKEIPEGECCRSAGQSAETGVAILSNMRPNQAGRIAFVRAGETRKLQKLMAMGVLPGKPLRLIQRFPSYVFAIGHSQFAIDEDMARAIHVRVDVP